MLNKQRATEPGTHSRSARKPRARGEAKLARLRRALRRVIARSGAGGVTHREVAKEAGVSLSATTYYFASKQDMVRQAMASLADEMRTNLDGLVARFAGEAPGSATTEDEIEAAGQFVKARLRATPEENLTLIELMLLMARDSEARRLLSEDRGAVRAFAVSLLERSHSSSPEEDTDLLMALVTGLTLESLARGRPPGFEERAARIVERVMAWLVSETAGGSTR